MNGSEPSPQPSSRVSVTVKRVLTYAFVGALVSGVAAAIMFGSGPTSGGGSHGWALIMAPTFAIIGAMMGAVYGLLVSVVRGFKK